jgi:hypothetical protein
VVDGSNRIRVAETGVAVEPLTGLWGAGAVPPYSVVRPYSKTTVVDEPLAFTVPFRVAPAEPTPVAAPVVAVGAWASAEPVDRKKQHETQRAKISLRFIFLVSGGNRELRKDSQEFDVPFVPIQPNMAFGKPFGSQGGLARVEPSTRSAGAGRR